MPSTDRKPSQTLVRVLSLKAILAIALLQLTAGIVTVGFSYGFVTRILGQGNYPIFFTPFVIATVISGVILGVAFGIGYAIFRRSAARVTKPLSNMAATATRLAKTRDTTRFDSQSDIVEINGIEVALNQLYEAEENQIDEQTELVRALMHDIRTPLSHITSHAEEIAKGSSDQKEAAADIINGCMVISQLIKAHAEITQNNSGKDRTPTEPVDVTEVVSDGCELYLPIAESKGLKLDWKVPNAPIIFTGHAYRLQRLFSNLVDNAIKYTSSGGSISVTLENKGGGIVLTVADTGRGIPEKDRPHIFDSHFRGDWSRHEPGYGLGLTMVKSIVKLYGGSIDFSTVEDKGTTFTVRLPLGRKG